MALDRTVAPPKTAAPPNTTPVSVTLNFGTSLRDPLASAKIIEGQAEKEAEKEDSEQE
jgi:hypothetical protein